MQKVFCLGFQKTGTTSLGTALDELGYRTASWAPFRDLASKEDLTLDEVRDRAMTLTSEYDAFKDTPWPLFYEEFDARFDDAKFIHIVRPSESWIGSVVKDFGSYPNAVHNAIYGSPFPIGNEADWVARYERHNREVEAHFTGRPERYLRLDLAEADWAPICDFLGHERVDRPWPRSNTHSKKKMKLAYWAWKGRFRKLLGLAR